LLKKKKDSGAPTKRGEVNVEEERELPQRENPPRSNEVRFNLLQKGQGKRRLRTQPSPRLPFQEGENGKGGAFSDERETERTFAFLGEFSARLRSERRN